MEQNTIRKKKYGLIKDEESDEIRSIISKERDGMINRISQRQQNQMPQEEETTTEGKQ